METKAFFQEALDLMNEIIVDQSKAEKFISQEYLNAESRRLRFYLLDKSPVDRVIIAEMVAGDILDNYLVLYCIGGRNEEVLKPMYCHIFAFLLNEVLLPLHIQLGDDFVKKWEDKQLPIWGFYHDIIAGWQTQTEEEFPHYHKDDEQKATLQFERLVNGGFFSSDTTLDDWLYVYGVKGKTPNKKPLDWQKTQMELGYLVRCIWQNTDTKQWGICERVFTVKGKKPNTRSIKSKLSGIENRCQSRPKTFDLLDEVLDVKR